VISKADLADAIKQAQTTVGAKEFSIKSGLVTISLDLETLLTIQKEITGDVQIYVKKADNKTLSLGARAVIGNRPVYDFSITGTDGQAHEIASSIYHEKTGLLSFVTDHFSLYGVGYKEFVTNRGLFGGTAEGIFSPNMSMTRGMLVTVLSRLAKADLSSYTTSHFADNAQITSYAKAAVKEMQISGIISGKDINQFDPQGTATRAEVSAVLKRLINILENK